MTPEPAEQIRVVARSVLANLRSLQAEGLPVADAEKVTGICRVLRAFEVDPVSRGVLTGQLREHLDAARGLTGRTFLGWLDDIERGG